MQPDNKNSQTLPMEIDFSAWRRAIRQDTLGRYHYEMGRAFAKQGETDMAVAAFHRALEAKPDLGVAALALADWLERTGRQSEGEAVRQRTLAVAPDYEVRGWLELSDEALDQKDWALVTERARRALEAPLGDALARPRMILARALRAVGRHREAIRLVEEAVTLDGEAICQSLEALVASSGECRVRMHDDRASVEILPQKWFIAAVADLGRRPEPPHPLAVTVRVHVLEGTLGMGVMPPDFSQLMHHTPIERGDAPSDVLILIDKPLEINQLVLYNAAPDGTKTHAEFYSIDVHLAE